MQRTAVEKGRSSKYQAKGRSSKYQAKGRSSKYQAKGRSRGVCSAGGCADCRA